MLAFIPVLLFIGMMWATPQEAQAGDAEVAQSKCVEFGFKEKTLDHDQCVKQFLKATGSVKAPAKTVPPARSTPGQIIKDCAECPELVVVPAGGFTMGSSEQEQALAQAGGQPASYTARESPKHHVRIPSFAVARYAITKGEFARFIRASGYRTEAEQGDGCLIFSGEKRIREATYNWRNVGFAQGDDHPVVCVSWNDAQAYIQWLSQISGNSYRLLSESEREYATRGGTQTAFWWGDSIKRSQANYDGSFSSFNGSPKGETSKGTLPANSFSVNPFGLYNVHGNVWEWTQDCWHNNYIGAPTDGSAWTVGCAENQRVIRGGSWNHSPALLRSAYRGRGSQSERLSTWGFRLARTL